MELVKTMTKLSAAAFLIGGIGCSVTGPAADQLNPFAANGGEALGQLDNSAIIGASGGGGGVERARHSLESLASYRRKQMPQPVYPVMQPAEVRLMWIPDHQTTDGNLVPAHYYYLKVFHDRWALEDAFEIEGQLHNRGSVSPDLGTTGAGAGGGGYGGATPWVYKEGR